MTFYRQDKQGDYHLTIKVKPNAKRSKVLGVKQDVLEIALHATPLEGKANQALIALLSEQIPLPKSKIEMTHGMTSRIKRVKLCGEKCVSLFLKTFE